MSDHAAIHVRGARQHNLKGFDVSIPHRTLTVITGPSGSGKSSLAFDTLYAEGQRRYVETFSPYTRQFLERMNKPRVDSITGIPPAIAIEQANSIRTTRSTVGTMTEIADYLKLLFPRIAVLVSPATGQVIRPRTPHDIADELFAHHSGREWLITFEVPFPAATPLADATEFVQAQGFRRVYHNGQPLRLEDWLAREPEATVASLTIIQDRVQPDPTHRPRLVEGLERALDLGKGQIALIPADGTEPILRFSSRWIDPHDGRSYRAPVPGMFSFNNAIGACPRCRGFGRLIEIDYNLAIPDRTLSLKAGAVKPWQGGMSRECQTDLERACKRRHVPLDVAFCDLAPEHQRFVIDGELSDSDDLDAAWEQGRWYGLRGYFRWLEARTYKMHVRVLLSRYRAYHRCSQCQGDRFQEDVLFFRLPGSLHSIASINNLPVRDAHALFENLVIPAHDDASLLLRREITARLAYLVDVGLGYLTLDRPGRTLSGGEIQRVNITACLGNSLVNTLFVLDEPSIGLHPRDTSRLIGTIRRLRDRGNTVVVVEHDDAMLRAADFLVELGPGRGSAGGELVFSGPAHGIARARNSLTGAYLTGRKQIPCPPLRRPPDPARMLQLFGARENNLRNLTVELPLARFVCVTGVSGSGKSTLVHDVLYKNILRARHQAVEEPGALDRITGLDQFHDVVLVDQTPLTKTPRSNPALYIGIYDHVREWFASSEEARAHGLNASSFSFNSGLGRCERCQGMGYERIEMQFLSDLFVECPACEGRRFQAHVLAVQCGGRTVAQILDSTVDAARDFFASHLDTADSNRRRTNLTAIVAGLELLQAVGLGYLTLGQPLSQLSGGESQRIKLVGQLAGKIGGVHRGNLLILDEPTTGLHADDIAGLVQVLQTLVERGHSLLVIEHNVDVIKCADWVVDLGPDAGDQGGRLVCAGTPETLAACPESHTGRFLREALAPTRALAESPRPASRTSLAAAPATPHISITGARHHNLQNISLSLPLNRFNVVTGLSGSGKSTLAFDIIFAEGQRRYLDSLNSYARQFVQQFEKPDVDLIQGIPPTVAIEQNTTRGGSKSTVATVTEIYHFVRLLYAKLGEQHDPDTGEKAQRQSRQAIAEQLDALLKKHRTGLQILAPLVKARKGFHTEIAAWALKKGFQLLRVDGQWIEPAAFKKLDRYREHSIDVLIGDISPRTKSGPRAQLLNDALDRGKGIFYALNQRGDQWTFSTQLFCASTGRSFEELDPRLFSYNSPHGWCPECEGYGSLFTVKTDAETALEREVQAEQQRESADTGEFVTCAACAGSRLNPVARAVRFRDVSIAEFSNYSVADAYRFLNKIKLRGRDAEIARDILPEILQRLRFLEQVGLGYLQLGRSARTLSGGESQRIRLAAQLGSNLEGVLYVLDEPTIGLHPRDNQQLLDILHQLRDRGNSLLVVEHDEDTMRAADHIVDLGPGAGCNGGRVVAQGSWSALAKDSNSVTGLLLGEPLAHPSRGARRPLEGVSFIQLRGARANNLQDLDVDLPLNRLTVVSGVSGAGKSTLIREVLIPAVRSQLDRSRHRKKSKPVVDPRWRSLTGAESLTGLIEVDQAPIGKTSRSCPATYTGVFDLIRALFAQLPESRVRGYGPGRFSFNTAGGRCERCAGNGAEKVEMAFLPAMWIPCEDCSGSRYNRETNEIRYKGKGIAEVLNLSIDEAVPFFAAHPRIHRTLALLAETGLGYLTLGQRSPTLSGGESQRLKLVSELARTDAGGILYILEEPTIGLHLADVRRLVDVLHRLVDAGNTVIVIEHHTDLIAEADYVLDIGPEGGAAGGQLVAAGTPEDLARCRRSHTGRFLKDKL